MVYHVEKIGDRWKVTNDMFFQAVSSHYLKDAAKEKAKKLARRNNENLIIHYEDGMVQEEIVF